MRATLRVTDVVGLMGEVEPCMLDYARCRFSTRYEELTWQQ